MTLPFLRKPQTKCAKIWTASQELHRHLKDATIITVATITDATKES